MENWHRQLITSIVIHAKITDLFKLTELATVFGSPPCWIHGWTSISSLFWSSVNFGCSFCICFSFSLSSFKTVSKSLKWNVFRNWASILLGLYTYIRLHNQIQAFFLFSLSYFCSGLLSLQIWHWKKIKCNYFSSILHLQKTLMHLCWLVVLPNPTENGFLRAIKAVLPVKQSSVPLCSCCSEFKFSFSRTTWIRH